VNQDHRRRSTGRLPLSANQGRAKITVLGMGGTIAMTRTAGGGVAPALSAAELVAAVPGLSEVAADVEVIDVRRLPGASLTLDDLRDLYVAALDAYAAGAAGVIVTQGTDTIEETAYLLDLWHGGAQPLVVTGAMRNPAQAGHDGPANLLAAVCTAIAPRARNRGVMVVIADQIHAAARVRKTHATSVCAFTSPNGGPLGQLVEGRPWFAGPPGYRFNVPLPEPGAQHDVGLVVVGLGDQGELLRGIGDRLDGLVVAGMGVGHVPAPLAPVLQDIAGKIPVVLTTRTGAGPVLTATYAFPGSERDLHDRGLIPAGLLDPLKARILLLAALRAGASRDAIAESFAIAGGYSDPDSVTAAVTVRLPEGRPRGQGIPAAATMPEQLCASISTPPCEVGSNTSSSMPAFAYRSSSTRVLAATSSAVPARQMASSSWRVVSGIMPASTSDRFMASSLLRRSGVWRP
jgi:L-asparaginase